MVVLQEVWVRALAEGEVGVLVDMGMGKSKYAIIGMTRADE